ncbi:MAG: class I SAM-dependent rRNA methyltransferase [Gammaproteobacteria bacterium]|nr:class I SAM-dependent rRNA methyltransferase [Gammaproteobacteria bacterium]
MSYSRLQLVKNSERRLRQGHCWIYSNEVDRKINQLTSFSAGQTVEVMDSENRFQGMATVSPNSLICARVYSRQAQQAFDAEFIKIKLQQAHALRERLGLSEYGRQCFGDADGLSGLVIDRFGGTLMVQIGTAAVEQQRDILLPLLIEIYKPTGIWWKNDSGVREVEGLPLYSEKAWGDVPDILPVREGNAIFEASLSDGQKTGWFYDHRDNRQYLAQFCQGKRVLDVFCYAGAWGIQAALAGAKEVVCVDSSAQALEFVQRNAALNNLSDSVKSLRGKALEVLRQLRDNNEMFDVIILDPPAFIKRKKDHAEGLQAYRRINELAMRLLPEGGILASASCSMHLSRDELTDAVRHAAVRSQRQAQIIKFGGQAPDHPVHPAIAETEYLKCAFVRVL